MTAHNPLIDATAHSVPRRSEDNAASQVLTLPIGAGSHTARSNPTGEAGAPIASNNSPEMAHEKVGGVAGSCSAFHAERTGREPRSRPAVTAGETAPNDGYGSRPRCEKCGRGFYVCICNVPEPEPEYFKPGINRDPDWHRVEF